MTDRQKARAKCDAVNAFFQSNERKSEERQVIIQQTAIFQSLVIAFGTRYMTS